MLKAVMTLYEKSCVRVNGNLSEEFKFGLGLQQGCVMWPRLSNVYMEGIMKEVNVQGYQGGVNMMNMLTGEK